MTRAEFEALARRVETEEPSRELDCRIAATFDSMAAERLAHPSATFNAMGIHTEEETYAANYRVLPYTSSLDAAVTLVPSGVDLYGAQKPWRVAEVRKRNALGGWYCALESPCRTKVAEASAPTEPQARTAAALRAQAQGAGDDR